MHNFESRKGKLCIHPNGLVAGREEILTSASWIGPLDDKLVTHVLVIFAVSSTRLHFVKNLLDYGFSEDVALLKAKERLLLVVS